MPAAPLLELAHSSRRWGPITARVAVCVTALALTACGGDGDDDGDGTTTGAPSFDGGLSDTGTTGSDGDPGTDGAGTTGDDTGGETTETGDTGDTGSDQTRVKLYTVHAIPGGPALDGFIGTKKVVTNLTYGQIAGPVEAVTGIDVTLDLFAARESAARPAGTPLASAGPATGDPGIAVRVLTRPSIDTTAPIVVAEVGGVELPEAGKATLRMVNAAADVELIGVAKLSPGDPDILQKIGALDGGRASPNPGEVLDAGPVRVGLTDPVWGKAAYLARFDLALGADTHSVLIPVGEWEKGLAGEGALTALALTRTGKGTETQLDLRALTPVAEAGVDRWGLVEVVNARADTTPVSLFAGTVAVARGVAYGEASARVRVPRTVELSIEVWDGDLEARPETTALERLRTEDMPAEGDPADSAPTHAGVLVGSSGGNTGLSYATFAGSEGDSVNFISAFDEVLDFEVTSLARNVTVLVEGAAPGSVKRLPESPAADLPLSLRTGAGVVGSFITGVTATGVILAAPGGGDAAAFPPFLVLLDIDAPATIVRAREGLAPVPLYVLDGLPGTATNIAVRFVGAEDTLAPQPLDYATLSADFSGLAYGPVFVEAAGYPDPSAAVNLAPGALAQLLVVAPPGSTAKATAPTLAALQVGPAVAPDEGDVRWLCGSFVTSGPSLDMGVVSESGGFTPIAGCTGLAPGASSNEGEAFAAGPTQVALRVNGDGTAFATYGPLNAPAGSTVILVALGDPTQFGTGGFTFGVLDATDPAAWTFDVLTPQ
jgi:hypothetical protein